jgi:ubiquinone/menaquinone biosynthesis C-methylase UbiE
MPETDIFLQKAEDYAFYRWKYAPAAVQTIFQAAGIGAQTVIADIGAGPGNLGKHFLDDAARVYMIDPSASMRQAAERIHGKHPAVCIQEGCAEATGLAANSIDLITVGQAVHYFKAEETRAEFLRILKADGWLAVLRNYGVDEDLNAAIEEVYTEENGIDPSVITSRPPWKPVAFYFENGSCQQFTFSFIDTKNREDYIQSLATASYAPAKNHPLYPHFHAAAGQVFDRFSRDGIMKTQARTDLYLGKMKF